MDIDNSETIQQLIKFSKIGKPQRFQYEDLFYHYNQELLVKICYNLHIDLDKTYDIKKYPKVYKIRTKALKLLYKWLNSNDTIRLSMWKELKNTSQEVFASYDAISTYNPNYTIDVYYASDAAYSAVYATNVACYTCGLDDTLDSAYLAHYASNAITNVTTDKQIVIKTICDYYKVDYDTFKALYL